MHRSLVLILLVGISAIATAKSYECVWDMRQTGVIRNVYGTQAGDAVVSFAAWSQKYRERRKAFLDRARAACAGATPCPRTVSLTELLGIGVDVGFHYVPIESEVAFATHFTRRVDQLKPAAGKGGDGRISFIDMVHFLNTAWHASNLDDLNPAPQGLVKSGQAAAYVGGHFNEVMQWLKGLNGENDESASNWSIEDLPSNFAGNVFYGVLRDQMKDRGVAGLAIDLADADYAGKLERGEVKDPLLEGMQTFFENFAALDPAVLKDAKMRGGEDPYRCWDYIAQDWEAHKRCRYDGVCPPAQVNQGPADYLIYSKAGGGIFSGIFNSGNQSVFTQSEAAAGCSDPTGPAKELPTIDDLKRDGAGLNLGNGCLWTRSPSGDPTFPWTIFDFDALKRGESPVRIAVAHGSCRVVCRIKRKPVVSLGEGRRHAAGTRNARGADH